MNSKQIKLSFLDEKPGNAIVLKLKALYWPIESFFVKYYSRISRSIAFARLGWTNYDFDFAYVYDVLIFKLERLKACLESGHAIQDHEDMIALQEAITICKRFRDDQYEDVYMKLHDEKWGEMKVTTDEVASRDENGKPSSYYWTATRDNVNETNEEQERKEHLELLEQAENDRLADHDRLASILKLYSQKWWD